MSEPRPIVIKDGHRNSRELNRLDSNQFDEKWLQHLLFENPQLLPVNIVAPHFGKLVPLAREVVVAAGAIDLLLRKPHRKSRCGRDKIVAESRAHRTVLAQILDYAKDLSRTSYSEFRGKIERTASRHGAAKDLLQIVSGGSSGSFDDVVFEDNLRRVLRTGGFEMFIVGDRIRPEVALLSEILSTAANLSSPALS